LATPKIGGWSAENLDLVEPSARQRLDALAAKLARDPASHGLVPYLVDFLRRAPIDRSALDMLAEPRSRSTSDHTSLNGPRTNFIEMLARRFNLR
jgi:hypothetical protein